MPRPVLVMDFGSSCSKVGYAGNPFPTLVYPTLVATPVSERTTASMDASTDEVRVGDAAGACRGMSSWRLSAPVQHGLVEDWGSMEALWMHATHHQLRVEPDEASVLLTEPLFNPQERREGAAEFMFETLGVQQLHVAPQCGLALRSTWGRLDESLRTVSDEETGLEGRDTGLVIDCGATSTSIVPIVGGYTLRHAAQQLPIGGRDITEHILAALRSRQEAFPPEGAYAVAERVKERYGRVLPRTPDPLTASAGLSADGEDDLTHREVRQGNRDDGVTLTVKRERFLGPELFFQRGPQSGDSHALSLPEAVDAAIWACPIDCRRPLYKNIVLCGGSSQFPGFEQRLHTELAEILAARAGRYMEAAGSAAGDISYEVHVVAPPHRQHAVFRGGSLLGAARAEYDGVAKTREQYQEEGPRIMRESLFDEVDA